MRPIHFEPARSSESSPPSTLCLEDALVSDHKRNLKIAALVLLTLSATLSLTLSGQVYDVVVTATSEGEAAEFLACVWVLQGVFACWAGVQLYEDWFKRQGPTPSNADKPAASSKTSLKDLVKTLKGRPDARDLAKLVKRLNALDVLHAGFASSNTPSVVKCSVNQQIDDLVAAVQNYCQQLDVPYLDAGELDDNRRQLMLAIEGCASLLRTHLRTANAITDSDAEATVARLAAHSELNKHKQ